MAYGVKYQLLCTGKNGVASKVVISEDGYTGGEIDRNIPLNGFVLRMEKGDVIKGTTFEFGIREAVDFEFKEFYTSNKTKFKVEFYYPSDTLVWSGFVNPRQYSGDYKPAPNTLYFQATDGLGLLKNEDFTLTGFNTELTILRHCIDKTGLSLGYAIAIELWEINHNKDYSPLAQTYIDSVVFAGLNCYEVIEKILGHGRYDATIRQWGNRWRIVSYKDQKATRLLYNSSGTYTGTEAAPTVQDLVGVAAGTNQVRPADILRHSIEPGGKGARIVHNYGRKLSLLDGYDFSLYSSSMFTYWTRNGSFTVAQKVLPDGTCYAQLESYSNVDTDYIYQQITVENAPGNDFVFEFDAAPLGWSWSALTGASSINMLVRVMVKLTVGSTVYYLTEAGWDTSVDYIDVTVASSLGLPEFQRIKVMTDEIPGSGTLEVRLMRFKSAGPSTGITYRGMAFANILAYFVENNELAAEEFDDVAVFDEWTDPEMLSDVEVLTGDAPDEYNKSQLYINITRLVTRVPTSFWQLTGNDTEFASLDLYVKMLASRMYYPREKLSGGLKGPNMGLDCLVKHDYNDNREFEIGVAEWDVYSGVWSVDLFEWFSFASRDITFASGRQLGGGANLTVASVTPASTSQTAGVAYNTTVHVDNTGESRGRQFIEWKVVDGSDDTISSGEVTSGSIDASDDADVVISISAPEQTGTYYVKCRIKTDTSWVSSAAITVSDGPEVALNSIGTIDNGIASESIDVSFSANNTGGAGNDIVYWRIYDDGDNLIDSGSEEVAFNAGVDTYSLYSISYPGSVANDYYLQLGMSSETMDVTSNDFDVVAL